jgi:hypothetical protein
MEMSTTVVKTAATRTPPTVAPWRWQASRRLPLALTLLAITLAAIGVGTWLIVRHAGGSGTGALSPPIAAPAWTPTASPFVERLQVVGLKKQLVRAGYSIKVDGNLDPVAKSASADYLQPDGTHLLSPFLASALEGTVITGLRNPSAWNSRFGLHRQTTLVERAP